MFSLSILHCVDPRSRSIFDCVDAPVSDVLRRCELASAHVTSRKRILRFASNAVRPNTHIASPVYKVNHIEWSLMRILTPFESTRVGQGTYMLRFSMVSHSTSRYPLQRVTLSLSDIPRRIENRQRGWHLHKMRCCSYLDIQAPMYDTPSDTLTWIHLTRALSAMPANVLAPPSFTYPGRLLYRLMDKRCVFLSRCAPYLRPCIRTSPSGYLPLITALLDGSPPHDASRVPVSFRARDLHPPPSLCPCL